MSDPRRVEEFRNRLRGGIVSAPLAGTSDPPWYRLLADQGLSAFFTEMITADGLFHGGRKTRAMISPSPDGYRLGPDTPGYALPGARFPRLYPPLGVPAVLQLFGHRPEAFAHAAAFVEECGYEAIDLNYGCPAKKVVRTGNGAALLDDLPLALEVAAATVSHTDLPVTAKLRLGSVRNPEAFLPLAEGLERLGVVVLTLHPRLREEQFSGTARWGEIARLVHAVGIPVIGNGDILSPEDARRMLEETGCRAVMVGRALTHAPWLAGRISAVLRGENPAPEPDWGERLAWTRRHGRLLAEFYGERNGMFRVRRFALLYLRGCDGARELRRQLAVVETLARLEELLDQAGSAARCTEDSRPPESSSE